MVYLCQVTVLLKNCQIEVIGKFYNHLQPKITIMKNIDNNSEKKIILYAFETQQSGTWITISSGKDSVFI